jgi:hypothetical protein
MDQQWAQDLDEWVPDRDQSYVPIWGASWSDYSGCGRIVILDKGGQLYKIEGGYNPCLGGESSDPGWYPRPISYEEALAELEDWEEFLT